MHYKLLTGICGPMAWVVVVFCGGCRRMGGGEGQGAGRGCCNFLCFFKPV